MSFTISQTPNDIDLYLYPTSNQSVSLSYYGDTTNYTCVDDVWYSANESDYVYTRATSETSDTYNMGNTALSGVTINYVRVIATVSSATVDQDTSTGVIKLYAYDGTNGEWSSNVGYALTNPNKMYSTWADNPSGSSWTWTQINALRIGIGLKSSDTSSATQACVPIDDGTYQEWSTGDYTDIDEIPANDSDYIGNSVGGSGPISTFPISSATEYDGTFPVKVELHYRIKYGHAVTMKVKPLLYINGSLYRGTETTCPSSWTDYSYVWSQNPDSGEGWEWADLRNLEIGIESTYNDDQMCSQLYLEVTYETVEIRCSQIFARVNYSPAISTVTLRDPEDINVTHSRNVRRHIFPSGNYAVDDYGRAGKTLTIRGTEISSSTETMQDLKDICHYGNYVTVAGLLDTNLNTDYQIVDFSFTQPAGTCDYYAWNISLEEI